MSDDVLEPRAGVAAEAGARGRKKSKASVGTEAVPRGRARGR